MKETFKILWQLILDTKASKYGLYFGIGWAISFTVMLWTAPHYRVRTAAYIVAAFMLHACAWSAMLCGWKYRRFQDHQDIVDCATAARKEFENVLEQHGFHRMREEGNVIPLDRTPVKWKQ